VTEAVKIVAEKPKAAAESGGRRRTGESDGHQ